MSNDTKTLNAIVGRVAIHTADAYSFDRYGIRAWRESIKTLLREYTEAETEVILRSKHMRWAADCYEGARGKIPTNTIQRWVKGGNLTPIDVMEMWVAMQEVQA